MLSWLLPDFDSKPLEFGPNEPNSSFLDSTSILTMVSPYSKMTGFTVFTTYGLGPAADSMTQLSPITQYRLHTEIKQHEIK
jgi:hypothetical protein